jgi:hypothetical protein
VNHRRSIADFLALRRNTVLLLVALVLAGTGERLWLGFAPKYLETLGVGVFLIGLFDALQTLLGARWSSAHFYFSHGARCRCPRLLQSLRHRSTNDNTRWALAFNP